MSIANQLPSASSCFPSPEDALSLFLNDLEDSSTETKALFLQHLIQVVSLLSQDDDHDDYITTLTTGKLMEEWRKNIDEWLEDQAEWLNDKAKGQSLASALRVHGSPSFTTYDAAKTWNFLSRCDAFQNEKLSDRVIRERHGKLHLYLPIGIPSLDIPSKILTDLSYGQIQEFHMWKSTTCKEVRILAKLENDVPLFFCWRSQHRPYSALIDFTNSDEGRRRLFEQPRELARQQPAIEQLVLYLLVMLWYLTLRYGNQDWVDAHRPMADKSWVQDYCRILRGEEVAEAKFILGQILNSLVVVLGPTHTMTSFIHRHGIWNSLTSYEPDEEAKVYWQRYLRKNRSSAKSGSK
ncbi:hypothetical protein F4821DRAFT_274605 [Hypoxylon rubiginosum]|uniref:Uncharacterized protein n=1 Tax=Hypoxylon rubiginosum TaxID=110542 RepID=A0ACC0CN00_9PEZI|nr:hypothetical protein F4821DRAFT_274605 [Hypoxylon rubiginosum]